MRIKYNAQVQEVLNSQHPDDSSENSSDNSSEDSSEDSDSDSAALMSIEELQAYLNRLNPEDIRK